MIDSVAMTMGFEIYGACSEKFEDFLKKMVKAACSVLFGPKHRSYIHAMDGDV